jgi:hypothetical protein
MTIFTVIVLAEVCQIYTMSYMFQLYLVIIQVHDQDIIHVYTYIGIWYIIVNIIEI